MNFKANKVREALENAQNVIDKCQNTSNCVTCEVLHVSIVFFEDWLSSHQAEWFNNKLEIGDNHMAIIDIDDAYDDGSCFCTFLALDYMTKIQKKIILPKTKKML